MNKTFIIAELSANHNHDKQVALDTIRAAKRCGADAVKIQTYTADTMTIDSNQEWFKIHGTIWNGENLYHLYQKAYTPWEWHEEIFAVEDNSYLHKKEYLCLFYQGYLPFQGRQVEYKKLV